MTNSFKVIFAGEEGEDYGGPRREFWSLLGHEVLTNLCEGRPDSAVLKHDSVSLMVRRML